MKLNKAIAEVVNAFARRDVARAWGDGGSVGTDGTQVDTYIDNLLAETSIRYGGYGGIAYHYVSDNYIALISRFVPCGAWEAIYIIDGLLANASEVKPATVHAEDAAYSHIGALFDRDGQARATIDWQLVENHWPDLMRVASPSGRAGSTPSPCCAGWALIPARTRSTGAFREVGRSVRTVALLRYLGDPALRRRVTAVTNKVEAYNGFSGWLRFGNGGVIAENDPAEQEKMIKFNSLLANCVIFHTALDMMDVLRQMAAEGWQSAEGKDITAADIAQLSPYITDHISRFGMYATDVLKLRPAAFDPELPEVD